MKKGIAMVTAFALLLLVAVPVFALAAPNGNGFATTGGNLLDTLAKLLGMTPSDIQTERIQGKSMVQIAEEKGVTEEKLMEAALAARKAQIDQLVKDGKITQAQADYMLTQMKTRIKANLERTTVGKPGWAGKRGNGQGMNGSGFGKGMNNGMGNKAGNAGVCPYVQP